MSDKSKNLPSKQSLKSRTLQCKNLHEYLKTLNPSTLDNLYNHPTTCLAVFRELPHEAKHFVIRLLFVEQPVPQAVISSWIPQAFIKELTAATNTLSELRVWHGAPIPGGLPGWILNPSFRKNLQSALLGGGKPWTLSAQMEEDTKPRDIKFLDDYAMERWECVLHYMVGSHQQEGISADAVRILLHAGLMKGDEEDGSPIITKEGFQFLLLDTSAQVWYFILQYLDTVNERGLSLVECLTFLFQLSFSTLGKDYSTEGLNEKLLIFLQHLREFGLVYQRKRKAGRFYPTRLALNLATSQVQLQNDATQAVEGYLVVETNYRVYAYTDSNLKVALLGLFAEMMYRFPNLSVGLLTRDSVRAALRSGITAEQIVGFLRLHAHPKLLANNPVLPPTIVDQIKLWENERDRFTFTDGVLYSQFLSQSDFITLRDYAQELGVLTWQNEKKRTMVVTKEGHDEVKKFWKRLSKNSS